MIVSAAGGGRGGDPAILAAINALNGMVHTLNQHFQPGGMVTNLVEELRSTNRTTAILANNNSLVLYDLLELKVSLYLEN